MRWRTKTWAFLLVLGFPGCLVAQTIAYVDLFSLAVGAAQGAAHLRGGIECPLESGRSLAYEAGLYWSSTPGVLAIQGDLSLSIRCRQDGDQGPFWGLGGGVAVEALSATSTVWGLQGVLDSEVGWTLGQEANPVRCEPFFRGKVALGPVLVERRDGGRTGWGFRTSVSPEFGFRVGWRLPSPGGQ